MVQRKVLVISYILVTFCVVQSRTFLPSYLDDGNNDNGDDELDPDEFTNLSTNDEEVSPYRRKKVDPEGSWRSFIGHSRRTKNKPRKNKREKERRKILGGPPGPPGPEGPPGPPGPPGSLVTKDEIIEELKHLIKEATERRTQELLADMGSMNTTSLPVADSALQMANVPRIAAGFNMRLSHNSMVSRRTFMELNTFLQPFEAGAFQRGSDVFNAEEGRFYAPRDGVFQFTSSLHIRVRSKRKPSGKMRRSDNVKVMICIDSLCQKYTSIQSVTGLESNSKVFTVQTTGMLQLQPKQYVSVYVDNSSAMNIVVLAGSEFTGLLLGV